MTTKRIYIFLNDPGARGGIRTAVNTLAKQLQLHGFEVFIAGVRANSDVVSELVPGVVYLSLFPNGRPTRILRGLMQRLHLLHGMRFERLYLIGQVIYRIRLKRYLGRRPGHLIVMDIFSAQLMPGRRSSLTERRIIQFHNSFAALNGTRDMNRLVAASAAFDLFLGLTPGDTRLFAQVLPIECATIGNPLPFRPRLRDHARPLRVVSAGRLEAHKGFSLLIKAWAQLPGAVIGAWTLDIIGDGPEREKLETLVMTLGVSDTVRLLGHRNDMQAQLENSELFVFASDYEGLPMVLLEAMSQTVTCIATDSSTGVRSLLGGPDSTQIVPVGDIDALAQALGSFMSNSELRQSLAVAGYQRSLEFSAEAIIQKWILILEDK